LWDNDALVSLAGLDAVWFMGMIEIWGNDALVTLDALGAVTWCGGMIITDNTALPTCEATNLQDRLTALGYDPFTEIFGNDDTGTCDQPPPPSAAVAAAFADSLSTFDAVELPLSALFGPEHHE